MLLARLDILSDLETTLQAPSLITVHRSLITSTGSRHRQSRENSLDNGLAGDRFRLGFVADDDAMPQDVRADALYVLRRDVAAAVQKRMGSSAERQINRRTW